MTGNSRGCSNESIGVRVALIGPVSPYRGGIAHHTEMLFRAMETVAERVLCISFSRQYPGALFPGENDTDPEKCDIKAENVRYVIDSMNPLTWHRAVKEIARFSPEIVVIPWWTWFWAPCFGYLARALSRRGIEVRFFCHNVIDHDAKGWKSRISRWVLRSGDSYVVQAKSEAARLRLMVGARTIKTHPHPIYSQFPEAQALLPRRASLELLFYGFVRPYKGLDVLLEALAKCQNADVHLTIAGEFWQGEAETRERVMALKLARQVSIEPRYHSDSETAALFERADLVVMPYRYATGSGVLGLAFHYGKPVIATAVGAFLDIIENGVTGILIPPDDVAALAHAIDAMPKERCEGMEVAVRASAKTLTWESLARCSLSRC